MNFSIFNRSSLETNIRHLIQYLKNPIAGIQSLPNWTWPELFFYQLALTSATGALAGLVQSSFLSTLHGLVIIPIITAILIAVGALFFYFFFQVFAGVTLSLRRVMTLIFFANIPFFIFQIMAYWFPPISLVGLAFTGLILITGFIEVFQLNRRLVIRTVVLVYALFALVWLWSRLDAANFERSMNQSLQAPPVHLDQ